MKKKACVTGGAGFIGSHLCRFLLERDYEVICIDNFFTGNKKNLISLLNNPYFEYCRHDIIHPYFLEVDEIYHLACPASPVFYKKNPIKTIKTAVMGTINSLGLAKRLKAKILLTSTSEVYGSPEVHPQPEEYWGNVNPIGERSCYDEGKRCAETLAMDYHRQNNVSVKIVRIFNTYGPNMAIDDGRVISNFVCQSLQNKVITIHGDGSFTRSFCYVDDLVKGLVDIMDSSSMFVGPINLGNSEEISMFDLAKLIIKLTKSTSKIKYQERRSDDPHRRKPDLTLAKKQIKWAPKVSLEEGLMKSINYFKNIIKN